MPELWYRALADYLTLEEMFAVLQATNSFEAIRAFSLTSVLHKKKRTVNVRRLVEMHYQAVTGTVQNWCRTISLKKLTTTKTLTDLVELKYGTHTAGQYADEVNIRDMPILIRQSSRMTPLELYMGLNLYVDKVSDLTTVVLIDIPNESLLLRAIKIQDKVERIYSLGDKAVETQEEIRIAHLCKNLRILYRSTNNSRVRTQEMEIILLMGNIEKLVELARMSFTFQKLGIGMHEPRLNPASLITTEGTNHTHPWCTRRVATLAHPRELPVSFNLDRVMTPHAKGIDLETWQRIPRLKPCAEVYALDLKHMQAIFPQSFIFGLHM